MERLHRSFGFTAQGDRKVSIETGGILIRCYMGNAAKRYRSFLLAVAVVAIPGCEVMPDPAFDALPKALTLRIVDAKLSSSRTSIDFNFELANNGGRTASACLGPSRGVGYEVDYEGGSHGGTAFKLVDHPGCTRAFTIEPGSVLSWAETIEVPELRQGRLEVKVGVQVTNPNRCGGWGSCSAFDVTSDTFVTP